MNKYLDMKKFIILYLNKINSVLVIAPVKDITVEGMRINCLHSNVSSIFFIFPFSSDSYTKFYAFLAEVLTVEVLTDIFNAILSCLVLIIYTLIISVSDLYNINSNIFKDNDSGDDPNPGEDDFKPDKDEFNPSENGFNPGGDDSGNDSGDDRSNKGSNKDKGKATDQTPEDIPEKLDKGKGKATEVTPEESPAASPLWDSDPGFEDRRLTRIAFELSEKVGESSKPLYIPLPPGVDLPKQDGELSEQGGDLSEKGGQLPAQGGEAFKSDTSFAQEEERLKNAKSELDEYKIAEDLRKISTRKFNDIMQKLDESGDSMGEREKALLLEESMRIRGVVDAATQHANHLKSQLDIPSDVEESGSEEYGESSGEEYTDVSSSDKEESRPSKRPRN
uniref:hypothetical protein n=1 Tax=Periconia digitata TaxID=1303443 RepID=UPI0023AA3CB3|nr:hypothetical protein P1Q94_mgp15 [Periconia digitata]WCA44861.1 hypothetical protein [Periconia digitata]